MGHEKNNLLSHTSNMFGIVLILLALASIIFASYRLGAAMTCETDLIQQDTDRNQSLTVLALGVLFVLSGVLAAMSRSYNPFSALVPQGQPSSPLI